MDPEIPSDQQIEDLLALLKIKPDAKEALKGLLIDPLNSFVASDKIWAVRQLNRIINAPKGTVRDLKDQFFRDVKNRTNIIPR